MKLRLNNKLRYSLYAVLAVVLFSCQGEELKHKVIISKSNESFFNEPLKDGWCRFFYKIHEKGDWIEFKEKCEKYDIGDTINVSVSNYRNVLQLNLVRILKRKL